MTKCRHKTYASQNCNQVVAAYGCMIQSCANDEMYMHNPTSKEGFLADPCFG